MTNTKKEIPTADRQPHGVTVKRLVICFRVNWKLRTLFTGWWREIRDTGMYIYVFFFSVGVLVWGLFCSITFPFWHLIYEPIKTAFKIDDKTAKNIETIFDR